MPTYRLGYHCPRCNRKAHSAKHAPRCCGKPMVNDYDARLIVRPDPARVSPPPGPAYDTAFQLAESKKGYNPSGEIIPIDDWPDYRSAHPELAFTGKFDAQGRAVFAERPDPAACSLAEFRAAVRAKND